jgi:hypothetical protein
MSRENVCTKTEEDLTAYHQGELSPERAAEVESHLASCEACRHALRGIASVFSMASSVEDIVPSPRFKQRLARMIVPAPEPLLRRVGLAVAFIADRLRTSPRFRFAAVSVAVNAVILLFASLVVLPKVARPWTLDVAVTPPDSIHEFDRGDGAEGRDVPDGRATEPDVEPLPVPKPTAEFPSESAPDFARAGPFLPPSTPVRMRPGVIFANVLPPSEKRRALAASFADPDEALAAVDKGVKWLVHTQRKNGSWAGSARGHGYETGVTATALLALLSDGNSETRGRKDYRNAVRQGIDWLLAQQVQEGELAGLIGPSTSGVHYTYNHAIATLTLVEAYSVDRRRLPRERAARLGAAIDSAVRFAVLCQTPAGAWKYSLQGGPADRMQNDTSVSIFMVTALTAARSARFGVPATVFRRFGRWLRDVTGEEGIVGYARSGDRDDDPRTLTAGSLFLEERLGLAAPLRERQAALVRSELKDPEGSTARNCLLRFYASLAFRLRGEPVLHMFGGRLLKSQSKSGAWVVSPSGGASDLWAVHGGDAFLTAVNVLTLTTAYRASV